MMRQNTVVEPRLIEIVEVHKSLGCEVGLEPEKIDGLDDKCRRCFENEID